MRQMLLACALLAGVVSPAPAGPLDLGLPIQEKAAKKHELGLGDRPPKIAPTKWLQGEPVADFEKGKIYVVEFWATWCGPCLDIMPHCGELQREYRAQGVTLIGFTTADPGNTAEKVAAFIKKRGPKLGYSFAFAEDQKTYDAYMRGSGMQGIPTAFVIDKEGKLAFMGHPAFLDYVLPRLIAGTWNPKEGAAEIAKADKEFDLTYAAVLGQDVDKGLKAMSSFEARQPQLAKSVYFIIPRIALLIRAKMLDEARAAAEQALTLASHQDNSRLLRQLTAALGVPAARGDRRLADLTARAADELVRIDNDAAAYLAACEAHASIGSTAQAKELAQKAVAFAEAAIAAEGDKKSWEALWQLAQALAATGDYTRAKEVGEKAIEAAPSNGQKDALKRAMAKFGAKPADTDKK